MWFIFGMDSLLNFLKRIHILLIFVVLEAISLTSLIGGDVRRNSVFNTSANYIAGHVYDLTWRYVGYFYLREENASLMRQLSKIRSNSSSSYIIDTARFHDKLDTLGKLKYRYITASVVKNSVSRQNNFITLDQGSANGVREDMAVISASGVVGVIVAVSEHYASAISLLNRKIGISAKLKTNDFYGSIIWLGEDYRKAVLNEIPNHVELHQGDTVVTSGYSSIFPPGIPIATIESFEKNTEDNFYKINVKLLTDMKCVSNVFIIENLMQDEQLNLESLENKFVQ
ncbi:MAG: rod shape-determining protein MreC [Bacteroidales bacterium]|nr:rod shape-determining protein MreC [Bacteroidales bacterium]MBR6278168.1 rod shape-determining protein MreC [Bacteroidales bacterium]